MTSKLHSLACSATLVLAATAAHAVQVRNANFAFESGATFAGVLTFLDDFSNLSAVSGTLQGGGHGLRSLTWVWSEEENFQPEAGGPGYAHNYLMDGQRTGPGLGNGTFNSFVSLNWNYANPANIVVTPLPGTADTYSNNVNYSDRMVSGSIAPISMVPEPSTYALLLVGLGVMGVLARTRRRAG